MFEIFSIYTRVLETSFGHAISISKAILAIWHTKSSIFDNFQKKCQICYFKRILQLAHILCKNSSRSWNMAKPMLKPFRVDQIDTSQYLSWSHIMSRSNFRFFEKKFSFFGFYAIFLKGHFRVHFRALILHEKMRWETFFRRILKKFLLVQLKFWDKFCWLTRCRRTSFHYQFEL